MRNRFMRIITFFDLPMQTSKETKNYTKFRRYLINDGFIMMQQSVYTKLVLNATAANAVKKRIVANKPPMGVVQVLVVTEKQFNSMEYIVGGFESSVVVSMERLVII